MGSVTVENQTQTQSDIPHGFQVVSQSDIPPGFQIESHPGIDFGQAANAAGKALLSPSPQDIAQNGLDPVQRAGQAALGSIYGQGKEALTNAVPPDIQESMGKGVSSVFLPPQAQGLVPKLVNQAIGRAGTGMAIDAGTGMATDAIGPAAQGLSKMASGVSEGAEGEAGRLINQYIKPGKAQYSFGKNPGQEVADQGITAWNREDLQNKIDLKLGDLSSTLQNAVDQHEANGKTKVDMRPAIQTISSKINELSQLPETTGPAQDKLKAFGRDILGLVGDSPEAVSPQNALNIKRLVGKIQSWAQKDPAFGTISDAARDMYHPIDSAMDAAMPETQPLNSSISNLIGAKTAMENGVARDMNKSHLGLFDRLGLTGLGGMLGFAHGGAPEAGIGAAIGTGATKLASSAFGRTNAAQALEGISKTSGGVSDILKEVKGPQLINRIMELFKPEAPPEPAQGLLTDTKQLPFPRGRGNFTGSNSGPTITPEAPPERPQIPQILDSDRARMVQEYGLKPGEVPFNSSERNIKPQGKLKDNTDIGELINQILKRRKSNFGGK